MRFPIPDIPGYDYDPNGEREPVFVYDKVGGMYNRMAKIVFLQTLLLFFLSFLAKFQPQIHNQNWVGLLLMGSAFILFIIGIFLLIASGDHSSVVSYPLFKKSSSRE